MPRKLVRLSVVRNERRREQARFVRRDLFRGARRVCRDFGDDLSGYVLVTWDRHGDIRTVLQHGYGPLAWASLPEHCRDAIQRHVTVEMAVEASERMHWNDDGDGGA